MYCGSFSMLEWSVAVGPFPCMLEMDCSRESFSMLEMDCNRGSFSLLEWNIAVSPYLVWCWKL